MPALIKNFLKSPFLKFSSKETEKGKNTNKWAQDRKGKVGLRTWVEFVKTHCFIFMTTFSLLCLFFDLPGPYMPSHIIHKLRMVSGLPLHLGERAGNLSVRNSQWAAFCVADSSCRKGWSEYMFLTAALLGAAVPCCFAIQSPEPSFADGVYMSVCM